MPKYLIVRFSSIGDIVLTTPVVRCLKTQVRDAEVHYLTRKSFVPVIAANPYISKVHAIEKNLSEVLDDLKKENYDLIIDLHHNLRSLILKYRLGTKSNSFKKLNIEKWMMVNFKKNILPSVHIVDRYLETVKESGIVNDQKGLDYFIPEKDNVNMQTLPLSHSNGYIGFVIGAKFATKRLPVEKIISICNRINSPIVLLGGPEDRETAEKIAGTIGEKVFNACGKFNLNQSASLVKQSKAIIAHDTGLMHIASAFKKKIISIWGNTIPEFGMYPYLPGAGSVMVEVPGLPCRPCSKLGFAKCPQGHFKCMKMIDEEKVVGSL